MDSTGNVAVVVPTYNRHSLLKRALDSICKQTVQPAHVVVVDDASPAPVAPFLEDQYDGLSLTVIRHDENRGAAAARNTGVESVDTEYVAFLDSDDYWDNGKLAAQLDVFESNPDLSLVYCDQYIVEPDETIRSSNKDLPEGNVWSDLLNGWTAPNTSTLVFNRGKFLDLGGFDTSMDSCQDHDLWMQLAYNGHQVGVVTEPLSYFTRDADDRISYNYVARMDGVDTFLQKWRSSFIEARSKNEFQQFAADYRAMAAIPIAYNALLRGDIQIFIDICREYLLFNKSAYEFVFESVSTLIDRLFRKVKNRIN